MDFEAFGCSDPGRTHDHNEDSFICNKDDGIFLVADGMGGQAYGEMASKLAVNSVEQFIISSRKNSKMEWPVEHRKDLSLEQNRLLAATFFGNHRIQELSKDNLSMKGMGTTLLGAVIEGENLIFVNVGDSRLYRIRDEKIEQMTKDHSLVGEEERDGLLSREEARRHPKKHILTSALGHLKSSWDIDVSVAEIVPQDIYLICSDGLYVMVDDYKILEIIASIKDRSLYKMGFSLVLQANLAGGLDNVTVVLLSFDKH
jgi:serine/threonine protein phosphatase PrpC